VEQLRRIIRIPQDDLMLVNSLECHYAHVCVFPDENGRERVRRRIEQQLGHDMLGVKLRPGALRVLLIEKAWTSLG